MTRPSGHWHANPIYFDRVHTYDVPKIEIPLFLTCSADCETVSIERLGSGAILDAI